MALSRLSLTNCSYIAVRYYTCYHLKCRSSAEDSKSQLLQTAAYSNHTSNASKPSTTKISKAKQVKKSVLEYGIVGTIFHLSTSALMFGSCYLIVTKFGEIEGALETFKSPDMIYAAPGLNFIVTLGLFKSLFPFRVSATCIGTWSIVRYYRCRKEKKKALIAQKMTHKM